jgi:RNA polymerase primary sigma factor
MKKIVTGRAMLTMRNGSFKTYLRDIAKIPNFTPHEEFLCAEKAYKGDKKAFDELITRNLKFVVSVAKQYSNQGISLEDLVNEGNYGLIVAAEKFEPSRGLKFISYSVWWIRKYIMELITKNGKQIRLPLNKVTNLSKLNSYVEQLEQKYGRNIDISEVMDEFGNEIDIEELKVLDTVRSYRVDSFDKEIGHDENGGLTLHDLVSDKSQEPTDYLLQEDDNKYEVNQLLEGLKPKEQRVIIGLFGLDGKIPLTLNDLADELDLTREGIRQIREKAIKKMKSKYDVEFLNN